jgi:hypothetical protein
MEKDVQFAFRVEAPLREQFVYICKGMDRPAGQVLREFMREYVREHIQSPLFDEPTPPPKQTLTGNSQENS